MSTLEIFLIGGVIIVALVLFLMVAKFFNLWLRARIANAPVSFPTLLAMWLRGVPNAMIVDTRITAAKAGIPIGTDQLEAHFLAGGEVTHVVLSLIASDKAGIPLDFNRACAIDLACKGTGKTVLEAVRTSINPKVIDCPHADMGRGGKIDAVAKDGISLRVRARVTVRTNLDRFVGGATEDTVIARVGEGIVTCIGSAASYKDVLENPDAISKLVLHKGVDSGTAFEILSIDIADIDVGENVGAKLQTEQAEADKKIAQAMAEMRRAAAVALEQEMSARTQEMRARVVEAEAQVPLAIAEAFRNGQLGVMDFAKYKNVLADTEMRTKIAGDPSGGSK
ncbi:MAG: flotillin-like protein FloA [Prosthecobacter sp.]|uniref:flotillin-like protein FloA n=1 Tax=Prosthecobacter sp. TaxID=1965333 RepID=UPI002623ABF7|nr:flotillin-like protein FloA [Prosthecobacter sp.]MCF7789880.1 flotillin-like protein FloA [Prosthecobacter sp.]